MAQDLNTAQSHVATSQREGSATSCTLLPIEAMSLTVALEQMFRGDDLAPNTAMVCVLALARITGRHDWTEDPKWATH